MKSESKSGPSAGPAAAEGAAAQPDPKAAAAARRGHTPDPSRPRRAPRPSRRDGPRSGVLEPGRPLLHEGGHALLLVPGSKT